MPAQKCATLQRASNLSAHEKEASIRANAWRADCANASESKKKRATRNNKCASITSYYDAVVDALVMRESWQRANPYALPQNTPKSCSPTPTLVGGGFCGIYLFSHLSTDVWEFLSEQTVRNDRTSRLIESNPFRPTLQSASSVAAC